MRPLRVALFAFIAAIFLAAGALAADYSGFIVRTKDPPAKGTKLLSDRSEDRWVLAETREEAEEIAARCGAEYICPNYILTLQGEPDDPYYEKQWTLDAIRWLPAYEAGLSGSGVTVAIIDSGIDRDFEDFSGLHLSKYSKSFVGKEDDLTDNVSHGTFVASQIAATADNGIGIAGIADGAELMILRAFNSNSVDTMSLLPAIAYAAEHGADVINMSFGDTHGNNIALKEAIDNVLAKGCIVVAAAGNYGNDHNLPLYPASYDGVISVASVSKSGGSYIHTGLSEYNDMVDIAAPGGSVYGVKITTQKKYTTASGTSFATPVIAAVAALMKQIDPSLTREAFYSLLTKNAQDLGQPGRDPYFGFGLVDVEAMLSELKNPCSDGHSRIACEKDGVWDIRCAACGETLLSLDLRQPEESAVRFGTLSDFGALVLAAYDGERFLDARLLKQDAVLDLSAWQDCTVRVYLLTEDWSPAADASFRLTMPPGG